MNNCTHQFFVVNLNHVQGKDGKHFTSIAKVICAFCAQVRECNEDGTVTILNEHGTIKHPKVS